MRQFLKRHYKNTGQNLFGLTLLALCLLVYFIYRLTTPQTILKFKNDYDIRPVRWEKTINGEYHHYRLNRNQNRYLELICDSNGKIMVSDLDALTTVKLVIDGKNHIMSSVHIDGELYKVPVVNDNPNPTEEQIRFLRALSKADTLTFIVENVKYTWSTENQTTLSDCVDLTKTF